MNPEKTKVILVGNSRFPFWGGEQKDILNIDQNIERLKNIFIQSDYCGIPDDQKHLIIIKDKAAREILLQVKHETKSSKEKGDYERLIFYYSGHGIPGEDSKLFFASNDTVRSDYEITSVDSQLLFSYLKGFGAKQLIVILDCCYAAQAGGLGDMDSLIEHCLPGQEIETDENETGAYYLYAAGKDNVAKFNPKEPEQPTYFTKALLATVENGIEPGKDVITMGELCKLVRSQIVYFNNTQAIDIPDPWPVLQGNNVDGFHFCRNRKFENQEDKDWAELRKDIRYENIKNFLKKYPETKRKTEIESLKTRLYEGLRGLEEMKESKVNIKLADAIMKAYSDIPLIYDDAYAWKDALMERTEAAMRRKKPEKTATGNNSKAADSDSRQEVKPPTSTWGESSSMPNASSTPRVSSRS